MKSILRLGVLFMVLMMNACQEEEPSLSFVEGNSIELVYGESKILHLKHTPHNAPLGMVKWSETNPIAAWANNLGKVYAWGVGESIITAETQIEGEWVSASCHVTVREVKMISLRLDTTEHVMALGEKRTLNAIYEPSNASFTDLSWRSSDENVATVNEHGEVSAKHFGECTISVANRDSSLTAQCLIVVAPTEMTSLQLSETTLDIELGKYHRLKATFEPADATYKKLSWSSSDESVATVTDGQVNAVGVGECVISVTNSDESLTAECLVKVYIVEMASLNLNETKREIAFGECKKFDLKATYTPSEVTYPTLYWSSSDESVAVVSGGTVEIVGVGSCVISVTNKNKTVAAQCEVKVYIQEITTITVPAAKVMERGESFILEATYAPSFVSPGCDNLYWESSDESVAAVNKETGEVTCIGVGECIITVGNTYNDVIATCRLTVLPISVKSISLGKTSLTMIAGQTQNLSCTIIPSDAANKEVKWESSDNSVATVSEDGEVTAISKGEAIIKVTALDGSGCSAECNITVMDNGDYYMDYYVKIECSDIKFMSGYMGYCNFNVKIANKGEVEIILDKIEVRSPDNRVLYSNNCEDAIIAPDGDYRENIDLGSGLYRPSTVICYFTIAGKEYEKSAIVLDY